MTYPLTAPVTGPEPPTPDPATSPPPSTPPVSPPRPRLLRPVDAKWPVTPGASFGARAACWGPRGHLGTDFACPEGTPVMAVDGGTVKTIDFDARSGYYVLVDHEWGTSRYCHFREFGPSFEIDFIGRQVRARQVIGDSGRSGSRIDGEPMPPHLHCGVQTRAGEWFDMEPCFATGPAPDVGPNDPGVEAITRCFKAGVLRGDAGTGDFRPDDQATRRELAWFASQFLDWEQELWARRGDLLAEALRRATGGDA